MEIEPRVILRRGSCKCTDAGTALFLARCGEADVEVAVSAAALDSFHGPDCRDLGHDSRSDALLTAIEEAATAKAAAAEDESRTIRISLADLAGLSAPSAN
jgi:hypothetical protein